MGTQEISPHFGRYDNSRNEAAMNNVIQLSQYRPIRWQSPSREADRVLWVCGRCGNRTWTVAQDVVRCAACETRARNLTIRQSSER
jgi:ribosomal protein L37E